MFREEKWNKPQRIIGIVKKRKKKKKKQKGGELNGRKERKHESNMWSKEEREIIKEKELQEESEADEGKKTCTK